MFSLKNAIRITLPEIKKGRRDRKEKRMGSERNPVLALVPTGNGAGFNLWPYEDRVKLIHVRYSSKTVIEQKPRSNLAAVYVRQEINLVTIGTYSESELIQSQAHNSQGPFIIVRWTVTVEKLVFK